MNVQSSGTHRQAQSARPRACIGVHCYVAVFVLAMSFFIVKNVAADTFSIRPLTNTTWDNGYPVISGDIVAWEDFRNAGSVPSPAFPFAGISTYNLSANTGGFTIPNASVGGFTLSAPLTGTDRSDLAISGNNIVWTGVGIPFGTGSYDIYHFNLQQGVIDPITTSHHNQSSPDISGTRVVWQDPFGSGANAWNLFINDLGTANTPQITTGFTSKYPSIDGHNVVWGDFRSGVFETFFLDLNTNTEKRIDFGFTPDISGDKIVYTKFGTGGRSHIWAFNLVTGENFQLTDDATDQARAFVSGNRVVYADQRSGKSQIYLYDLLTKQEIQLSDGLFDSEFPQIDGNRVVWMEDIDSDHWQIFVADLFSDGVPPVDGVPVVATPEPSSWILLVSGLLGLAVLSRGRRIKSRIRI